MPHEAGKLAVIYVRVSTEDQAEHGYSLAAQRSECHQKAQLLGADQVQEYADEGVSGSILERPGLMEALGQLKTHQVRWFIVLDTSRLSRSVAHQLLLVDEIKKAGTELVFVQARFGDTPEDRFQLTVMGAVDEYERARTRLRSLIGKKQKASQGGFTHSPGLYGYSFDKETDLLQVVGREAETIRLMFAWLDAEQVSPNEIAERLNAMGIPSPRGKVWSRQTVRRILANSAYAGTLYLHRYDTKDVKFNRYKAPEEKVQRRERPREEWLPISIEPIVPQELWASAQTQLEDAQRKWRSTSKYPYLLSGLLRCGHCGATMHGNLLTLRGTKQATYVCTAKSPGITGHERCRSASIEAGTLDELVWSRVSAWLAIYAQSHQQSCQDNGGSSAKEQELKKVEAELTGLKQEQSRVATLFQKQLISEPDAEGRLRSIIKCGQLLQDRQKALRDELQQAAGFEPHPATGSLTGELAEADVNLRKAVLQLLVKEIVVTDERATMHARVPDTVPDDPRTP